MIIKNISKILNENKRGAFSFLFIFIIVKSTLVVVPFLLSNILSTNDYGVLEYSLSIGSFIAILLNFGMNGAYPFFILKEKDFGFESIFPTHYLFVAFIILLGGCISFFQNSVTITLSILISGIIAIQMYISVYFKSKNLPNFAVFFDAGIYLLLGCSLIIHYLSNINLIEILKIGLVIYLTILSLYLLYQKFTNESVQKEKYKKALLYGSSLVLSAFLVMLLTVGGRIFINHLFSIEEVAIYSFYFRLASLVMIIHQVVTIFFFKKYYNADIRKLDNYIAPFIVGISIINLIAFFLSPFILQDYFKIFLETYKQYFLMYLLLTFQIVFWILFSLNETIIYREKLSKKFNVWLFVLLLIYFLTLILLDIFSLLTLDLFVLLNSFAIVTGIELQVNLIKKNVGYYLVKTKKIYIAILCVLLIIYFSLH